MTITKEIGRDYQTSNYFVVTFGKVLYLFSNVESFKNGNVDLIEYLQMSLTIITAGLFGITLLALSLFLFKTFWFVCNFCCIETRQMEKLSFNLSLNLISSRRISEHTTRSGSKKVAIDGRGNWVNVATNWNVFGGTRNNRSDILI